MVADNGDDLVLFQDVRVIHSTAPALLCRIRERCVWLPRGHISGRLCCRGDRGKLLVRRWVARDRNLIGARRTTIRSSVPSLRPLPAALHLVRRAK